jgi:hypothetical protein
MESFLVNFLLFSSINIQKDYEMQSISVYLYPNKIDAYTNVDQEERYRRVYNRNIKVYRGTDNRLDIRVKNSDQKPNNISGYTVVFKLIDRNNKLVYEKDCTAVDATVGRINVTMTEAELVDLERGDYQYSLIKETRSYSDASNYVVTSSSPLYVDSQYDAFATLEILGDVSGQVVDSLVINKFAYTNPVALGEPEPKFYVSSLIDAKDNISTPQTLHTFQIFPSANYSGTVKIQGSLDEDNDPDNWVDLVPEGDTVVETVINNDGTPFYKNIVGKYRWFRIYHTPRTATLTATFTIAQTILSSYNVGLGNPGLGYSVGDVFTISGGRLGGESVTNDLVITVLSVDSDGRISDFSYVGVAYPGVRTFVVDAEEPLMSKIDKILYR